MSCAVFLFLNVEWCGVITSVCPDGIVLYSAVQYSDPKKCIVILYLYHQLFILHIEREREPAKYRQPTQGEVTQAIGDSLQNREKQLVVITHNTVHCGCAGVTLPL